MPGYGLISCAAVYTRQRAEVAKAMAGAQGVAMAIYPSEGGSVVLPGPRDDVVLRLVAGASASARIELPAARDGAPARMPGGCSVWLLQGEPEATPIRRLFASIRVCSVSWVNVTPF